MTSQTRILLAGAAAYAMTYMATWVQPAMIGQILRELRLSEAQAGAVASIELLCVAVTSLLLARLIRGGALRRWAIFGAILSASATAASVYSMSLGSLLLTRGLAGIGEGFVFFACNLALVRHSSPDRAVGLMNLASILSGGLLVAFEAHVKWSASPTTALPALLLSTLFLMPFLFFMPGGFRVGARTDVVRGPSKTTNLRVAMVMLNAACIPGAGAMTWAFYDVLGHSTGLTNADITRALSLSVLAAALGSAAQAMLGTRLGRMLPFAFGIALSNLAVVGMCSLGTDWMLRWGVVATMVGIYFTLPYGAGAVAEADATGRMLSVFAGTVVLVGALSPVLGGFLFTTLGPSAIAVFAVGSWILGWNTFRLNLRDASLASSEKLSV